MLPLLATHQARVQYNTVRIELHFFGKTYQFSDHRVDFESVSVAFSYFQRIFAKEKYRLSFMRLNCNSGGNSPRVRYCALAQKVA